MLLTVDVGNTNTVLGIFDKEDLVKSWRVKTDPRTTADELWLQYSALISGYPLTGLSICSTVPATLRELRTMIATYFSEIKTTIVEPGTKTGVQLLVDNPKEIGADRIVNTLAAHTLYGGPAIVVDFGTSTNLDVVSPKGEFLGGALAPGIEISVDALAARAAQLRKVELVRPKSVIGKNTVEALRNLKNVTQNNRKSSLILWKRSARVLQKHSRASSSRSGSAPAPRKRRCASLLIKFHHLLM